MPAPGPKINCFDDLAKLGKRDLITGCLEWQGYCNPGGYGRITFNGKQLLVHRVAAFMVLGIPLDTDFDVMHQCDNRKCFEPTHLQQGTRKDNMRDAKEKGRLKRAPRLLCKRGHKIEGDNVFINSAGKRQCKICRRRVQFYHNSLHKR